MKLKPQTVRVEIEAVLHHPGSLFLRIDAGKAEGEGKTWEMATAMDGTPIVRLPDGRWVTFSWAAILEAATRAQG